MFPRHLLCLPLAAALALLVSPSDVVAQDGDDDILEGLDELDGGMEMLAAGEDDQQIYEDFKSALVGLEPDEEASAWRRYLDDYPLTNFGDEIESRIADLDQAFIQATTLVDMQDEEEEQRDRKFEEMDFPNPVHFLNGNPRQQLTASITYGLLRTFNFRVDYSHAFGRRFAVHGGLSHTGTGFGADLQVGARYAIVKSTRLGFLFSVGLDIVVGFGNPVSFGFVVPSLTVGGILSDRVSLQARFALDLDVAPLDHAFRWGVNVTIKATDKVAVYLETDGRIARVAYGQLASAEMLLFFRGSTGVRITPNERVAIHFGVNAPYLWRGWYDYGPIGIDAGAEIRF